STPKAASNGWRRTKDGLLDGGGTSGRSRLSLAVMRHRLDTPAGRDADQPHSSITPRRVTFLIVRYRAVTRLWDRLLPSDARIVWPHSWGAERRKSFT